MEERYLIIKVFVINALIRCGIIRNVWYKAELDLAKIRAEKLAKLFGWDD